MENPHSQAAVLSLLDPDIKMAGGKELFLTYVMKTIAPKPQRTTTHEYAGLGIILLASSASAVLFA